MLLETRRALFRDHDSADGAKVTNIELFFDLVFVFATTQLSSRLLAHLTPVGAFETLLLFLAIWWLWMYTSWATNWLDPERGAVRLLLLVIAVGSLVLSAALPDAFGKFGMTFAVGYVVMQVVRTAAIALVSIGVNGDRVRNFVRILFYFALSAPLWIAGATASPLPRLGLWSVALAIEYAGPLLFFATPLLGRSKASDWDIAGAHMAERSALFVLIALGEAIVITGSTFAGLGHDVPTIIAFATSFAASAAMWWIYFDTGAKRAERKMEDRRDAGRLGRNAYTYMHMPIVAAIVVTAVGEEMMLAHPLGQVARHVAIGAAQQAAEQHVGEGSLPYILVACGGPLMFLIGNQLFKWMTADRPNPPLSHFVGEGLVLIVAALGLSLRWTPLDIGMGATGALIATAAWEWFAVNGGWRRWTPWIGRRAAIALEATER